MARDSSKRATRKCHRTVSEDRAGSVYRLGKGNSDGLCRHGRRPSTDLFVGSIEVFSDLLVNLTEFGDASAGGGGEQRPRDLVRNATDYGIGYGAERQQCLG